MKKITLVVFSAVLLILVFYPSQAQQSIWHQAHGPYGGQISSLAVDSKGDIFAGTIWNGIYRSTDDGNSWQESNMGIGPGDKWIASFAVDRDDHIYAATHDGAIYFSSDGVTWTRKSSLGSNYPTTEALHINSEGDIFAVTQSGFYRSGDGGDSWTGFSRDQSGNALYGYDVAIDGNDNIFISAGNGVFRSTDNGEHWMFLTTGINGNYIRTLADDKNGILYAGSENMGIFRSSDSGASWIRINNGLMDTSITCLAVDSSGHIIAGTMSNGIFISSNGGENWTGTQGKIPYYPGCLIADSKGHIFIGTDGGGVYFTSDDGMNWIDINFGLQSSEVPLLFMSITGDIFACSRNGVCRSQDNGLNWTQFNNELSGIGATTLLFPNDSVILAGTGGGIYRSINNGQTWKLDENEMAQQNISSLALDHKGTLFAGTSGTLYTGNGVFRSTDNGVSWQEVNNGIEHKSINIIAVDLSDYIFAASNWGNVYRSMNGGDTWADVSQDLYGDFIHIDEICIRDNGTIYLNNSSALFRSTNHGDNWERIGIGYSYPSILTFALDQHNSGVYASIWQNQILRSFGDTNSWNPVGELPQGAWIYSLLFAKNGNLLAGSSHNGVYIANSSDLSAVKLASLPLIYSLRQNYPNPFNSTTSVQYSVPSAGHVILKVYTVLGQEVQTLVEEQKSPGNYEAKFDGGTLVSGIYFYRLQAGSFSQTRKLVLLK
jgi:photosystem II stability/assembly factor-like uncharacterized protein